MNESPHGFSNSFRNCCFSTQFTNKFCYQDSGQKPTSLVVWGCISAYGASSLHMWKRTINAKSYIGFRAKYAPIQMASFLRKTMHISVTQYTVIKTTLFLRPFLFFQIQNYLPYFSLKCYISSVFCVLWIEYGNSCILF